MHRSITIAVVQCALGGEREANLARVVDAVHKAADRGAHVVVTPELFEGPYFPRSQKPENFDRAFPLEGHPTVQMFSELARTRRLVLPVSLYEKCGPSFYNSAVVIDADGSTLGVYRKTHIPDGPGYQEKFYFRPGDTGFRVWNTRYGKMGVAICWDQWFPEAARTMALLGAEFIVYPTTIGSEPEEPSLSTKDSWQRVMIGHAVANAVPIAAANRVGTEGDMHFYGASFVVDVRGEKLCELGDKEGVALATVNLDECERYRASFGFFRDRRPELYGALTTGDGNMRGH